MAHRANILKLATKISLESRTYTKTVLSGREFTVREIICG